MLIAHDPLDALTLADRVTLLEDGRQTQPGPRTQIRQRPVPRYAADLVGVNLFAGVLTPLGDGAATLRTERGEITVAPHGPRRARRARASRACDPIDVSLHTARAGGSARNVFRGTIGEIAIDGERARVRVASPPPLTAEITAGSVDADGPARRATRSGPASRPWRCRCRSSGADDAAPPAGTLSG